ncbi:MAG TPA: hypothetical protein VLA36_15230 [Longimicrobiales bacterium]|nr:hypothetical protein [Longimicrobiales bacterium]
MEKSSPATFIPTSEWPTRDGPTPTITAVVLVSEGGEGVARALDEATSCADECPMTVLVVHRGNIDPTGYSKRFPEVRWFAVGAQATDAELRERGMSEADGDIVRFLDERFPATWSMVGIP